MDIYFLAVETSCDDTAIAVMRAVESGNKLKKIEALSNVVSSQTELHAGYGGVYPFLAKREHQKNLPAVFPPSGRPKEVPSTPEGRPKEVPSTPEGRPKEVPIYQNWNLSRLLMGPGWIRACGRELILPAIWQKNIICRWWAPIIWRRIFWQT